MSPADIAADAVRAFLAEHPLTESVDLLLPDLNGVLRGKRLRADQLAGALAGECFFTISLYALDSTGTNVDRSGIVWEQGDPDRPSGPRCERLGGPGREVEVFLPDRLEDQERFFALVEEYAAAQDVAIKSALSEYAPSQFELNLG